MSLFGQPFGTDLQNQYLQQLQVMQQQTYEAGFMAFLGTKFSSEYVNSPDGKVAVENLLATIRKSIYNLR